MKPSFQPAVAILCLLLSAAGCGQKAPLFLPGDEEEDQIEIPSQESEDGADDNEQPAADND